MRAPIDLRRPHRVIVGAFRILAWLLLLGLVVATLSPIGLRPSTAAGVAWDRGLAYAVTAIAFTLSYPGRGRGVVLCLLATVTALEPMQFLSATRHPGLVDAFVKSIGALAGSAAGNAVLFVAGHWGRWHKPTQPIKESTARSAPFVRRKTSSEPRQS